MGKAIIIPGADFSNSGLGVATLTGNIPVETIAIDAPSSFTGSSVQLKAKVYPLNTAQRGILWSIVSGDSYASVNASTGLLSLKSAAHNSPVVVRATSTSDANVYADKLIYCTIIESGVELIYGLKTDGAAGIRTDYVPNVNTELRAKFIFDGWGSSNYPTFYGNVGSNPANEYMFAIWKAGAVFEVVTNAKESNKSYVQVNQANLIQGNVFNIIHAPSSITVGEATASIATSGTGFSGNDLCIFSHALPGQPTSIALTTLLEFDIYEAGTLVKSYRPARKNGVLGVYDLGSGVFFENAYSGSFTEVQEP